MHPNWKWLKHAHILEYIYNEFSLEEEEKHITCRLISKPISMFVKFMLIGELPIWFFSPKCGTNDKNRTKCVRENLSFLYLSQIDGSRICASWYRQNIHNSYHRHDTTFVHTIYHCDCALFYLPLLTFRTMLD